MSTSLLSLSEEAAALAAYLDRVLVTVYSGAGGGSGTSWSDDGLIVTNHHVVGGGEAIYVQLKGRGWLPARVVGAGRLEVEGRDRGPERQSRTPV